MGRRSEGALKRPNVLLVALDQLRADHLHCYGYFRETSPNIDRLAKEGVLFRRMYSVASWTTPSFVSAMTSLYPSRHGLTLFRKPKGQLLPPSVPLLQEQFKRAGYRTVAFVNNALAGRGFLDRGFDEFYQGREVPPNITERIGEPSRAPGTTAKITAWLRDWAKSSPRRPFFMFVIYFEPHSPYNPPPEDDIFKTDAYPEERFTGYDPEKGRLLRWAATGDGRAVERLNGLYDGLIHFVDRHFGALLHEMRRLEVYDDTIIALFSDHGELLYERPDVLTFDHRSLYDANIRVPLIIRGPGVPKGKVVDVPVFTLDIAPTLLELAGLPPLPGAQGRSLLPLMRGRGTWARKYLFSEQDVLERLRCVRDERYKLILNLDTGEVKLFDTLSDPAERFDLATREPEVARRLLRVLRRWMEENHPSEREILRRQREAAPGEVVVDEVAIGANLQLYGTGWRMADHDTNFQGACYWAQPDATGSKVAIWRTDNPLVGVYNIYVWYGKVPAAPKVATNAKFTVVTRRGSKTIMVDQNKNVGKWNLLGRFRDPLYVRLTSDADGPIVVDAVKFERIG